MNIEVGDIIRITRMNDPFSGADYEGREGEVTSISVDPWGDTRLEGTWGGCALYPSAGDQWEKLDRVEAMERMKQPEENKIRRRGR